MTSWATGLSDQFSATHGSLWTYLGECQLSRLYVASSPMSCLHDHESHGTVKNTCSLLSHTHSTTASILNLAAISLDRYFHIKDPLSYERWMTRRIIIGSIVIIWSLSAMVSFVPISLGWHRPPNIDISNQISSSSLPSSSQFTLSSSTSSILQSNSHQFLASSSSSSSASASSSQTLFNSPTFAMKDEYHQTQSKSSSLSSSEKLSQVSSVPLNVMNQSTIPQWWQINNDSATEDFASRAFTQQLQEEQSNDHSESISSSSFSSSNSLHESSLLEARGNDEFTKRYPFHTDQDDEIDVNMSVKQPIHMSEYLISSGDSESDLLNNNFTDTMKQVDSSEILAENSFIQSELRDKLQQLNDDNDDDEYDDTSPQCALDLTPIYAVVSSAISFYIPCLIMIGLYTQLYLYAKKHVQNIRSFQVTSNAVVDDHEAQMSSSLSYTKKRSDHQHNTASGGNNSGNLSHHPHQVTEHKAAITLGIIMGTFLLCWVRITFVCVFMCTKYDILH